MYAALAVIGSLILALIALDRVTAAIRDRRDRRERPARVAEARRKLTRVPPPGWPRANLPSGELPTHADYPEFSVIEGGVLRVHPDSAFDRDVLLALGGHQRVARWWALEFWGEHWDFVAADDAEWAALLSALRDAGVVFLGAGPGMHLGGEFEALRDAGRVSGHYHKLEFGPGGWRVSEG